MESVLNLYSLSATLLYRLVETSSTPSPPDTMPLVIPITDGSLYSDDRFPSEPIAVRTTLKIAAIIISTCAGGRTIYDVVSSTTKQQDTSTVPSEVGPSITKRRFARDGQLEVTRDLLVTRSVLFLAVVCAIIRSAAHLAFDKAPPAVDPFSDVLYNNHPWLDLGIYNFIRIPTRSFGPVYYWFAFSTFCFTLMSLVCLNNSFFNGYEYTSKRKRSMVWDAVLLIPLFTLSASLCGPLTKA